MRTKKCFLLFVGDVKKCIWKEWTTFKFSQYYFITWSSTILAEISYSLATHTAAVFLTYGSSSFRHFRRGSQRYSVILSTRMQPIVRTASARINGFESSQSWSGQRGLHSVSSIKRKRSNTSIILKRFALEAGIGPGN